MVRKQIPISAYKRVKGGKMENVRAHQRTIDASMMEATKKAKETVKTGKATNLIPKSSFQLDLLSNISDPVYREELETILESTKEFSGLSETEREMAELNKELYQLGTDFQRKMGGWRVKTKQGREQRIPPDPDNIRWKELGLELYSLEKKLAADPTNKNLLGEIEDLKRQQILHGEKLKNKRFFKDYFEQKEALQKELDKKYYVLDRYYFNFVDNLNESLNEIKKQSNYKEFYFDDNLTLIIQKKEPHEETVIIGGKKETLTFPIKNYSFDDLPEKKKRQIINLIRKNFESTYESGSQPDFLKSFKDKRKRRRKRTQTTFTHSLNAIISRTDKKLNQVSKKNKFKKF